MRPYDGKSVLLVVSGGIAAYKTPHLVRLLRRAGTEVEVVMTAAGKNFVGKSTFEGLTGRPVHSDLWERPMAHLDLGREADLVLVAPATADVLARMAHGRADDLAAATLLATPAPVLVAPAMNVRMWEHPATRENVERLRRRGVGVVGPEHGELAEEEVGTGRMSEPDVLFGEAGRVLEAPSPLEGRKVVVTAGPTREPLDPVRYLGNRSSGRMGFAVAASAWRRGADVVLVAGPTPVPPPHGPRVVEVERSEEMLSALRESLPGASALVMAAAVADFRPVEERASKLKRGDRDRLEVELEAGPDLLEETAAVRGDEEILTVGFALETDAPMENARRKLEQKGVDLLALNVPGAETGFDAPTNRITLLADDGSTEEWPLLTKEEAGDRLLDRLEERLEG